MPAQDYRLILALAPNVAVALGRGRLGDIDRVGTRECLFQPFLQRLVEPALFGTLISLRFGA
ncbi:hypothetical protein AS156_10310 [Bradyrhizobium macuxiense]|uniref:Uncharacterized protein n=1 Tax=Bradyrhizobium macuxiense TaxID=1755647 RepID=A0A109JP83_9BRAD|nr:hypothetical protein AS156_10310 [Bradyrhizobium macuxiense]